MVSITLGKVKQSGQLVKFLAKHAVPSILVNGNTVQVEFASHRQLKLPLRKFLHERGLDNHRVVSRLGAIEIFLPTKPKRAASLTQPGMMGLSPFSPYRMNPMATVEFPNYPPVPPRKYKVAKRRKRNTRSST